MKTRRKIINLLKQHGPTDAESLGERLGITGMAVRQHLYALQEEQVVTYQEKHQSMGRPMKIWQLTEKANELFPNAHAELTVALMDSMVNAFGEDGLDNLLNVRTREQTEEYREHIPPDLMLSEKLERLAEIRTEEGYMAEVQEEENGDFLLIENHCPICLAANACTGLCSSEIRVFQNVLGNEVEVERTEHIVEGARRCVYRIQKNESDSTKN